MPKRKSKETETYAAYKEKLRKKNKHQINNQPPSVSDSGIREGKYQKVDSKCAEVNADGNCSPNISSFQAFPQLIPTSSANMKRRSDVYVPVDVSVDVSVDDNGDLRTVSKTGIIITHNPPLSHTLTLCSSCDLFFNNQDELMFHRSECKDRSNHLDSSWANVSTTVCEMKEIQTRLYVDNNNTAEVTYEETVENDANAKVENENDDTEELASKLTVDNNDDVANDEEVNNVQSAGGLKPSPTINGSISQSVEIESLDILQTSPAIEASSPVVAVDASSDKSLMSTPMVHVSTSSESENVRCNNKLQLSPTVKPSRPPTPASTARRCSE